MSDTPPDGSQQQAAQLAGVVLLVSWPLVIYANFAIQDRLVVAGDAAETARNILAHPGLFRLGIALDLIHCAALLALVVALYTVFGPVHRTFALLAAAWRAVYAFAWIRMTLNLFEALRLLGPSPFLAALPPDHLQALARYLLSARFEQYYLGLLFWGLASTVACALWWRSRYIPRSLALAGLLASAWAAFCAFAFILNPAFETAVGLWAFDIPLGLFELVLAFWLLIRGLRSA
jgi:hypothetical protein